MRPELEQAKARIHDAARDALEKIAFDLAGKAAAAAPIDTGRLRGSVSPGGNPEFGGSSESVVRTVGSDRIEVEVSFSTPYAAAQHEGHAVQHRKVNVYDEAGHKVGERIETTEWRAQNWPRGGGPKYLENPLKEMAPRYAAVIAENVRRATHG